MCVHCCQKTKLTTKAFLKHLIALLLLANFKCSELTVGVQVPEIRGLNKG